MDIAMHYLKSWFLLDFLTSLPIDSFLCVEYKTLLLYMMICLSRLVAANQILAFFELSRLSV